MPDELRPDRTYTQVFRAVFEPYQRIGLDMLDATSSRSYWASRL